MQLIRVKSKASDNTGNFSNNFRTPVVIAPHSSISLVNAVVSLDTKQITVTATNNSFSFKRSATEAPSLTVTIPVGEYSIQPFIAALATAMNTALTMPASNVGFLWTPTQLSNGVLKLNYARSNIAAANFPTDNLVNCVKPASTTKQIQATTAGNMGEYNSFAISDNTLNPGCSKFTVTIGSLVNDAIIGVMREKPSGVTNYNEVVYDFGIVYEEDANYQVIINGVVAEVTNVIDGTPNDVITITLSGGQMILAVGAEVLHTVAYDFTASPFKVACSLGARQDALLKDIQFNVNLDTVSLAGPNNPIMRRDYSSEQWQVVSSTALEAGAATVLSVTMDDDVKQLLGFDHDPPSTSDEQGFFLADQPVQDTSTPLSLTVEVPNIGRMMCHDGIDGQRRQIVAVIPKLTVSGTDLTYEAPYPLPIELDNAYPISMSHLDVRLLNSTDNSEVNLEAPGCSLLFAIHNSPQTSQKPSTNY